jgi:hypothetical protein
MEGTLVFVHGTGVREQGYQQTFGAVQKGADRFLPGVDVVGVPWGPRFGVALDRLRQALPPEAARRGDQAGPAQDDVIMAAWALLVDDPLFELRLIAQRPPAAPRGRQVRPLVPVLRGLTQQPPSLDGTGVSQAELNEAVRALTVAPELTSAAQAVERSEESELLQAVARALVAWLLASHRLDEPGTAPPLVLDSVIRARLVEDIAAAMAPVARGRVTDWAKSKMMDFAKERATAIVADRRTALMGGSTPGIGDILAYQRRGEPIRQMVADALSGARPPVVAVGHSLGGIILVDLLSDAERPAVDLLVTAGSQSPLFYVIDALAFLRLDQPQPAPFTPWLNIYDRQDFLSFYATQAFAGVNVITDEAVNSETPFPASHSAYWHYDRVFELIRDHWPDPV